MREMHTGIRMQKATQRRMVEDWFQVGLTIIRLALTIANFVIDILSEQGFSITLARSTDPRKNSSMESAGAFCHQRGSVKVCMVKVCTGC